MRWRLATLLCAATLSLANQALADTWLYVAGGGTLRYLPGTSAPPPNWFAPSFQDTSWTESKAGFGIGYGDNDDATELTNMEGEYLTVYVRSRFQAGAEIGKLQKLHLQVRYDDGFAAWLNGTEIARQGLPAGPLSPTTPATSHEVTGSVFELDIDPKLLVQGENVFAAEVHNQSVGSSDLSFLPVLTGWDSPPPPVVITRGPYLQQAGRHGVLVVWDTDAPAPSRVRYGLTPDVPEVVNDPASVRHHVVELKGLPSASTAYYQIQSAKVPSPVEPFVTEPDLGDKFRVVVFGDTRSNHSAHGTVVDRIVQEQPDLVVHTGDLVGDGTSASLWDTFFSVEARLLRTTPLWPALGNHESDADNYFNAFELPAASPGQERYYSFRWATVMFVVLDIYGSDFDSSSAQYAWLDKTLAAAASTPGLFHRFVALHQSPYSSGSHGSSTSVRTSLVPLFEKHKVEMVFSGHDHDYERGTVKGIKYIVTGGGGAPLYDIDGASWTEAKASVYHYVLLELDGPRVAVTTRDTNGNTIDSFVLGDSATECVNATECAANQHAECPSDEHGEWQCVQRACVWNCSNPLPVDAGLDSTGDSGLPPPGDGAPPKEGGKGGADGSPLPDAPIPKDGSGAGGHAVDPSPPSSDSGCACEAGAKPPSSLLGIALMGLTVAFCRRKRTREGLL